MKMSSADELTLARRAAAGYEVEMESLYSRYADVLFAFICHHMAESRSDAEDVYQDTWLAALNSLSTYNGQSRFFTWLCGIARHKIADRNRRCNRGQIALLHSHPSIQLSRMMDDIALPEKLLRQHQTRVRVVKALAILPEEYRLALTARYADECTVKEVAQQLGRSYKAIESLLSRARKALREALAEIDAEESDGG